MSEYRIRFPNGDRTYRMAGSPREAIGMVVDGRYSYTLSAGVYMVAVVGETEEVTFLFEPARITQL